MLKLSFARRGAPLTIGIGTTGIALSCGAQASWEAPLDAAAMAAQLRALLNASDARAMPARVVLADQWTRLFMVSPPANAGSLADCQAAAAMRLQELYGTPAGDWEIEAEWDARDSFLACALPRALRSALLQIADDCRLTLLRVQPQFIAAWNRWHGQLDGRHWFGVTDGESISVGAIAAGRLCAVQTIRLPAAAADDAQWLPRQIAQQALRLNLDSPAGVQLCGPSTGLRADTPHCLRLHAALPSSAGRAPATWLASLGEPA